MLPYGILSTQESKPPANADDPEQACPSFLDNASLTHVRTNNTFLKMCVATLIYGS